MSKRYKKRFITTYGEWQYNPETDAYDLINKHGFWYEGPVAEATHNAPNWVAEDWRFHHFNGGSGSFGVVWLDSENSVTNVKLGPGDYFRFRFSFGDTNNASYDNVGAPGLEYYHDEAVGGGSWTSVGTSDGEGIKVNLIAHAQISDGANDSTERLTNSTLSAGATYQGSWNEFNTTAGMTSRTWADDYAEFEWNLALSSSYFATGDTLRFRVSSPSTSTAIAFTTEPAITIAAPTYELDHWQMCYPVTGIAAEDWTGVGTEDTSYEIPSANLDTAYAICISISNSGGHISSDLLDLEYRIDTGGGYGSWLSVSSISTYVKTASTGDTDNATGLFWDAANRRLTADEVFFNFILDESSGEEFVTLRNDTTVEMYFGIQFVSADLSGGESIQFRVTDADDAYTFTYNVTPVVTIEAASADHTITFTGDPPDGNGEVTLAGKAPTVHWTITSAAEELALAGKVPALDLAIESGREELSLTGKVPTVHWTVISDREELALAGKQATVHWTVTPGRDELNLTGKVTYVGISKSPAHDELSLTGKAPTLKTEYYRIPDREQLALAGKEPVTPIAIESDREELALAGKAPSLALGISVAKGTITLAGKEPALVITIVCTEAVNSLEIIEKTPTLFTQYIRGPPIEELDLQGKAPTVHWTITSPREQLDLSGDAPTVHWTITPARLSLSLTGKVPDYEDSGSIAIEITVPYLQLRLKTWVGLNLYGYAPTVINTTPTAVTRDPAEDTLDLAGKALSLDLAISPARDELDLTGKASTVHWTVISGREELTLTGKAPVVFREKFAQPDRDELTLAGKAPVVFREKFAQPDRDELTLAGKTPALDLALSPARDELNLTGKVPESNETHYRAPARLELSLTGKVPAVLGQDTIESERATLTLAGKAPTVLQTFSALPDREQLALAGKTPTLFRQDYALPDRDTLALAGKTPVLFRQDYVLPDRDTLALAGKTPTLEYSWTASPARYELTLVGKVPAVLGKDTIESERATLALTGKVPTLTYSWTVFPTRDELTLTGKTPSLFFEYYITPTRVNLSLSGKVPALTYSWTVSPARATLALTGKVPELLALDTVAPTEGALALAGKTPVLFRQDSIQSDREQLSLAGKAPSLGLQRVISPDREQLALTGKVPTFTVAAPATPAIGTLSLAGKVPTLGQTYTISPAKATLSLASDPVFTIIPGVEGVFLIAQGQLRLYSQRGLWLRGITPTVLVSSDEITTAVGSLTLAGKTPTLDYSWTVKPTKGELTLTGNTFNVQAFTAEPDEGALALTGKAPLAKGGPPITIAVGRRSLSLNTYATTRAYGLQLIGYEPFLETPGVRSPNKISLSLTPTTPTVINTTVPPVEISVPEGQALSIQGYYPAQGIVNPNQEETFILEGRVPISWTTSPTFFPDRYNLTITEKTIISDVEGLAPAAHLFLAGRQPNTEARTLIPGAASLSLSGKKPVLTPEPPAASLSLAGAAVYTRRTVTPSTGTATFTLFAPAVFSGVNPRRAPAAGSLALSGKAPVVNIGRAPLVFAADLSLTGYTVVADRTLSADINTLELKLSGYAPKLFQNLPVFPSKGILIVDGNTYKLKLKRIKIRGARKELLSLSTKYDIEILYR